MNNSIKHSGKVLRLFGLALWLAALVASCGGISDTPKAGGESHFLSFCDNRCGDGLSCISGVCTRSCLVGKSSCSDLAKDALCTSESIEPGAVAVCDLPCSGDAGCSALGASHRCEAGYCRAGESRGSTAASCRVAHRTYPSGSTDIPPPTGCGACSCTDGELDCQAAECPDLGVPLVICPEEIVSDPIDVQSYLLAGSSLTLEVGHSGGCGAHDYALCFDPSSRASFPEQFTVRLIHDAHGDTCAAALSPTLKFDLTKIAETYNQANQANGGIVSTPYGLYAFGDAACTDRARAAEEQVERAVQQVDRTCTTAADCQVASVMTECSLRCSIGVSQAGAAKLDAIIGSIDEQVCGEGCPSPAIISCPPAKPVECIDGQCVY